MATISIAQIIGQPFPIEAPPVDRSTSPPPFVIYDDSTLPHNQHTVENDNPVILPPMNHPPGPFIAPDGSIDAHPSPEEATTWFPDDEASLYIADRELRTTVDRVLLSQERQPSYTHFLACAIVKHFGYWLWLMKGKNHPHEHLTIGLISVVLKRYLMKAIHHPPGLDDFEKTNCVQIELFMTREAFRYFPQLCDWVLDKNWATLGMLVDPRTDQPAIMVLENNCLWGGYIKFWISAMAHKLEEEWINLEFLCIEEFFTVPYPLIMVWEAQKNRVKDLIRHCEKLLIKVEKKEARVLQEVSGNARPDPRRVVQYEGTENRPPGVERRVENVETGFLEW
ncbi:hypothetical protein MMC34_002791 [Xylographa carneopallida]|nr:hypothetical protein [Xylographa carneopallida]